MSSLFKPEPFQITDKKGSMIQDGIFYEIISLHIDIVFNRSPSHFTEKNKVTRKKTKS